MDDLVNEIVQRIGITTLQAEERVTISVAQVKERLPSDFTTQYGGLLVCARDMSPDAIEKARSTGASITSADGNFRLHGGRD